MTERKDDGGPAFPILHSSEPGAYEAHPGMSLRDWFAGQALVALQSMAPDGDDLSTANWADLPDVRRRRAEWSYKQADAMLAERAKK